MAIYKKRLDTAKSVRQYLANVVHAVHDDKMDSEKARCIGYLCNIMIKSFEVTDFEDRLTVLEGLLKNEKS
ncbi:MAG: hypothetical protein PVJ67_04960 [Candidatus Pacearchaeota archaeon]|jgi:hypothetical protein